MADAVVKTETVKTVVGVTLELTEKEALAVYALCGSVGGTSEARSVTDGIYLALGRHLDEAGVDLNCHLYDHPFKTTGSLYFSH